MPSARARAAKAATAARIAAYRDSSLAAKGASGALEWANNNNDDEATDVEASMTTTTTMPGFFSSCETANNNNKNAMVGHVDANHGRGLNVMPTLPSMMLLNLNLNTASAKLSRALPVGAVMGGGGGGGANGSDEENIQPGTAGATGKGKSDVSAEAASGHNNASRPLSPMMLGNRDHCGTKDVRAYEIERQREKKGAELAKRHARKAGGGGAGGYGKREKAKANVMDVDIEEMLCMAAGSERKRTGPTWEVSLSELVVHKKARKAGTEDDFEMIPRVRSVIVLDDGMDAVDIDLDEPWEHVESLDEAAAAGASYASILAGAVF